MNAYAGNESGSMVTGPARVSKDPPLHPKEPSETLLSDGVTSTYASNVSGKNGPQMNMQQP